MLEIERQGAFFVGGQLNATDAGRVMSGQMFVQFQEPRGAHAPPIVMMHGWWQTGAVWLSTPDGREGWANFFLRRGHPVYVVDLPGRGRSAFHANNDSTARPISIEAVRAAFVDPHVPGDPEGAARHTQWPKGCDAAILEQFYASHVSSSTDDVWLEETGAAAGAALLDKIGPAILLTHSGSGPVGWLVADRRPELVKAIVAIEPAGPPFADALGPRKGEVRRPWGLTATPLSFEPALGDLEVVPAFGGGASSSPTSWGDGTARRLVNLRQPILMVMGGASYHTAYDHLTAAFLERSGARVDFAPLVDHGIEGNGHMMMLEMNSDDIAAFIADWLCNMFRADRPGT